MTHARIHLRGQRLAHLAYRESLVPAPTLGRWVTVCEIAVAFIIGFSTAVMI